MCNECCNHCKNQRETKKEYYRLHRDEKLKQIKEYQEKNKDILKEKRNENLVCICGGKYTVQNKSTHFKSKKHIKYEESLLEKS